MFDKLSEINSLIDENESEGRNELIKFLGENFSSNTLEKELSYGEYSSLINHLIRRVGLYPYMDFLSSHWTDKIAYSSFSLNIDLPTLKDNNLVLHREQSDVLKLLLEGKDILLMAPTSFGKTFIINSFIKINNPNNVVIIVPTITLMDEIRRNIQLNFSEQYKVITTTNESLGEKNILIFPQERAFNYIEKFKEKEIVVDFLVIDEFYKVSSDNDKERSSSLQKVIINFTKISQQRYYLTPSITDIQGNSLIKGMNILNKINFNTVFLNIYDQYKNIEKEKKEQVFLEIMNNLGKTKTLIYAGTFSAITELVNIVSDNISDTEEKLCLEFHNWLEINYTKNWDLLKILKKGYGIHNGKIHRSLGQIQIKLFEENNGLNGIISTSSIIEGVNTSAKNIIIWKAKDGPSSLNKFTYKNIIGRAGRMFKYFIGDIYVLDNSNKLDDNSTQLNLEINEDVLISIDANDDNENGISNEKREKIIEQIYSIDNFLGKGVFQKLIKENKIQITSSEIILKILKDMQTNSKSWNGFLHLNSEKFEDWEFFIKKLYFLIPSKKDIPSIKFDFKVKEKKLLKYIEITKSIWSISNNEYIYNLESEGINILEIFQIEKFVSYKLSAFLSDVNELYNYYFNKNDSVAPFINKLSSNFLPQNVFILEEYGLPRVISRKIQDSGLLNLEDNEISITEIIKKFKDIGFEKLSKINTLDNFDKYILEYFYKGI